MKENFINLSKSKKIILGLILLIMSLIVILLLTSNAYLKPVTSTSGITNVNVSTCGYFQLINEENNINLTNAFPMSDNKGMNTTPYSFDVKNTCDSVSTFNIYLIVTTDSEIDDANIKVNLNKSSTFFVNTLPYYTLEDDIINQFNTNTGKTIKNAYLLDTETIVSGGVQSFDLRMWIADIAGNEIEGKSFYATIAIADSDSSGKSELAKTIIQHNGGAIAIEAKGEPEFSEVSPIFIEYYDNFGVSGSDYIGAVSADEPYITYADSYTFDSTTGTYSLVNPVKDLYSNVYTTITGKYVLENWGSASSELGEYENIETIYKIIEVIDSEGFYYSISETGTINDLTDTGVYATLDNYGTSYYFRGAVDNNWVKFADKYWRIVRVNGDSSVRLIYSGTTAPTASTKVFTKGTDLITDSVKFTQSGIVEKVGYMYTEGEAHGNTISGEFKTYMDGWYDANLSSYGSYIADTGFCYDRVAYTDETQTTISPGYGGIVTYFAPYFRIFAATNPSLLCSNSLDLYTIEDPVGNTSLSKAIGGLTLDEAIMAGYVNQKQNTNNYLYSSKDFTTFSPILSSYVLETYALPFGVITSTGEISRLISGVGYNMRPVINLKGNLLVTGAGTWNAPYEIVSTS